MSDRGRVVGELSRFGLSSISQNFYTKPEIDEKLSQKSSVSVSNEGTATDEISYITIDGVEKKIKSDISTATLDTNLGDYKTELLYDSGTFIASTSTENISVDTLLSKTESEAQEELKNYLKTSDTVQLYIRFQSNDSTKSFYTNLFNNVENLKTSYLRLNPPGKEKFFNFSFDSCTNIQGELGLTLCGYMDLSSSDWNTSKFTLKIFVPSDDRGQITLYIYGPEQMKKEDYSANALATMIAAAYLYQLAYYIKYANTVGGLFLTANVGSTVISSSGGSSFTEVNISEETANLLTQPGTTELTSSNNAQVYNDLNNVISTPNAKITFNGEYGVSCIAIEGSHFVYGEYGETKTFEYAMPLVIQPRKVIIYKYNTTITLKVITDDQIEFNSISRTVGSNLNTSYDHHYISFMDTSTLINDEVDTDKIIFKLIDANKYVTTPLISSYNGAMHPIDLAIPYQDYYFIIGKYKVIARYFSNAKGGWNLIKSNENNSDPFADTPSTSLEGLVLACVNDQGVVDNTLTDEFAQTYFVVNCVIKVMGKGAFYFD